MKILNYTMKGSKLMLIAHAERNEKNGEMNPVFDLYHADDPCGDSIAEGMTLNSLVDMLTQMRKDIEDLIYDDGGVRDPMLRNFMEEWSTWGRMERISDGKGGFTWVLRDDHAD